MKRILPLIVVLTFIVLGTFTQGTRSAGISTDMKEGKVTLQSMGPLAFGPDGILFAADTKAAALVAIATGDTAASSASAPLKVEGINQKVAALLGTAADQILIQDLAINPISHNAYLAVSRGRGPEAVPVLVRVKTNGSLEVVALDKVKFSRADLPDAPAEGTNPRNNPRLDSITNIGFIDGRVLIAGLSNEEFASTLRAIPFPFSSVANPTSVEIYHGSHGRFETRAPVRTFTTFKIGKEDHVLAAYTCTPLVDFPISELTPGAKVKGKTIAELGNGNRPLDMVVYQKDGKNFLLMANNVRGVMKINLDGIESAGSITAPVKDKQGLPYETITGWTGVEQLARYDSKQVTILRRMDANSLTLETLLLP